MKNKQNKRNLNLKCQSYVFKWSAKCLNGALKRFTLKVKLWLKCFFVFFFYSFPFFMEIYFCEKDKRKVRKTTHFIEMQRNKEFH